MPSIYGQHLYSENRYSWIGDWARQLCEPEVWYKTSCPPQTWVPVVCDPAVWLSAGCGPVPSNDDGVIEIPTTISGTIAGQVRPFGSIQARVGNVGTITGVVRPVGNLQGVVLDPGHFVGILPQFGPIHHMALSVSTDTNPNDTETMTPTGTGTGLSLDRIPEGNVVWKFFVETASIDARICLIQEVTVIDTYLQYPPGFAYSGVGYKRDGNVYDGFTRPVGGPTWGSGSYLLMAYKSGTGEIFVGTTDLDGTNPVWFGDPFAGTGEIGALPFTLFPHVAIFGVGGDVLRFLPPLPSELP
jgi:hypothetical protein